LLTVKGRLPRAGAVQIGTLFVSSLTLGLIGVGHSLGFSIVMAVLTGLLCGVCGGLSASLVQTAAAPGYLGRVTSVMSLTSFGLAPLAYPLFGATVGAWGPTPVFLASAGFGALGGVVGLLTPAIRRAELPRAERKAAAARTASA
jgi:MFS family permease